VFVNAESASGYVLRYCVYTGSADAAEDDTATTHGVVMSLMEKYLDKNHKLFTDNFYTSLLLCKELYERGTYLCGTVQQRRKHYPEKMKVRKNSNKNNLFRPQYRFATCGDYTVGLWHDRRDITFVSSMHSASVEVIQKRPKGGREREPIPCPSAIVEYNQHMNGVDITDQHLSYHSLTRKVVEKIVLEIDRPFNTKFFYSFSAESSRKWYHIQQSVPYSTCRRDDKTTAPCKG